MKSARSTDESTQCRKRNTENMRYVNALIQVAVAIVATVVPPRLNDIFDQDEADQYVNDESTLQSTGSSQTVVHVVVDGVESNRLRWSRSDDEEIQSDGREVRIKWGDDMSHHPDCDKFYCRAFSYELVGFGPGPYTLECWLDHYGVTRHYERSRSWPGPEDEDICWVKGNRLLIPYVVVDGVESNRLRWSRSDDEEIQSDGREVRIKWGDDMSHHPDCDKFYCRAFSYELVGFGPGPYTLECWLDHYGVTRHYERSRSWPGPEDEDICWVKGNRLLIPYVVVDGVESNRLRWER